MNRLREIRELRGVSQTKLASICGVHQPEISRIERSGITPQSESKRAKLAKALGVSAGRLFPDVDSVPFEDPLPPKRVLFKSSRYPEHNEPVPMTRAICSWCGIKYNVENEVKIVVGDNTIKTYGHLPCLEQDIRTSDGLELKKRGMSR